MLVMNRWIALGRVVADRDRPRVMGIVNATPDSFSDGGLAAGPEDAIARAEALVADGADLLDIGGESSRPGANPVGLDEEIRRVIPVVEGLAGRIAAPISVDTSKPEVARRALDAGAAIINDIYGLDDPAMIEVVADSGAGVVLMHMLGTPRTMQKEPRYVDVVSEVIDFLAARVGRAVASGIARERIAIDPGIGFGKTLEHNLTLLRDLGRFASLGCAVLVGTSRKGFLGTLTGRDVSNRATASVVSSLSAIRRGAGIVRVHDVAAMVDAVRVWTALEGWGGDTEVDGSSRLVPSPLEGEG
jgi:dihydropteroate synthase